MGAPGGHRGGQRPGRRQRGGRRRRQREPGPRVRPRRARCPERLGQRRRLRAGARHHHLRRRIPPRHGNRHVPYHPSPVAGDRRQALCRGRRWDRLRRPRRRRLHRGRQRELPAGGYTFPLDSSEGWSTLAGAVLYAALFGALGAATGSLIRNQVAAIVGWLAWLFVVEHIAIGLLPDLGRRLPAAAGQALVRAPNQELLAQPTAAAVLAIYGAAIMSVAIVSERYRDA